MLRILIGLLMLAFAVALLGYAGGIDVQSVADWQQLAQKWSLPRIADNERCFALLTGGIFTVLAGVRFVAPLQSAR